MNKGGEKTQKTEIDPEFKRRILSTFDRADALSKLPPVPYQGLTMAAPSDATKQALTNTNKAASMLGVGMEGDILDGLPKHEREMGGIKGYSAHRGYQQELQRMYREYPELYAQYQQFMPGLLSPAKIHQGKENMFPGWEQRYGKNAQSGMAGFPDIYNIYKSRGRVGR